MERRSVCRRSVVEPLFSAFVLGVRIYVRSIISLSYPYTIKSQENRASYSLNCWELWGKSTPVRSSRERHQLVKSSVPFLGLMASCYWAQPKQLHPWYKPATHKRKNSAMFYRTTNESPFPVDENQYDPDSRAKRQRRITLDQACSRKRRLPSPPQSPIEDPGDPRHFKRQRCTTLERRIESLSLHPPEHSDEALSTAPVPQAPEFAARPSFPIPGSPYPMSSLPRPPLPPPVASASLCNTPAPAPVHAAPLTDADTTTDVKMHSSSWYEPEKDRACLFIITTTPLPPPLLFFARVCVC